MDVGGGEYLYIYELMTDFRVLSLKFEINTPVKLISLYSHLYPNHDDESIYYIDNIERASYICNTKFYIRDVDNKTSKTFFHGSELLITSEIRINKIMKCNIKNVKIINYQKYYRIGWQGMQAKHDTWIKEDIYKFFKSEKHRIYGYTKCGYNCIKSELRRKNKNYINPEVKQRHSDIIWRHRIQSVNCKKKGGIFQHINKDCEKKYQIALKHLLDFSHTIS